MTNEQEQFESLLKERVRREQRASKISAFFMVISLAVGGGWLWFSYLEVKEQRAEKQLLEARRAELESEISAKRIELQKTKDSLAAKRQELNEITPIALKSFGWLSDSVKSAQPEESKVEQSIQAQVQRSRLVKADTHEHRTITIRYYPKDVDRGTVERALRELNFRLDIRHMQVPDVPTNALWYGAGVEAKDVKLVALTLMRAGVQLRAIRPFDNPGGPKKYFIEIGADRAVVRQPAWTVERLVGTEKF